MRTVLRLIAERLAEPSAVSRHVQAVIVVGYLVIGVPYNVTRLGGSFAFWFVAMLACQVLIAAVLGNVARLQRRPPALAGRALLSVLLYATWGAASAVLVAFVGVSIGLADDHILLERLTIGILFVMPVGAAAAVAIGSHWRHRELVDALETELERLRLALAAAEGEIAATRATLQRSVASDLLPRLAALRDELPAHHGEEAVVLHRQLAADARSLAHRLAEESRPWRPPVRPAPRRGRSIGLLAPAATLVRPVSPGAMTAILIALTLIWTSRIVGIEASLRALLAVPWMRVVLAAGDRVVRRLAGRTVLARAVALTGTFAVAGVPLGGLAATDEGLSIFFTWSILVVGVGLGWTIALAYAWDERRQTLRRDLEAAIAALDHAVARTNQRLRIERERLARVVHGPIQDRLIAAGERLAAAGSDGEDALREAAALLDEAERLLGGPAPAPVDLERLVDGIAAVWDGVATVRRAIDPAVVDVLRTDDAAAETAAEIIREGISNAVRHGRSRVVDVAVSPRCPATFVVEIVGDGSAAIERTNVGLGTRYLEAATVEWRLDREEGRGSRLRAVIPWAGAARTAPAPSGLWRP